MLFIMNECSVKVGFYMTDFPSILNNYLPHCRQEMSLFYHVQLRLCLLKQETTLHGNYDRHKVSPFYCTRTSFFQFIVKSPATLKHFSLEIQRETRNNAQRFHYVVYYLYISSCRRKPKIEHLEKNEEMKNRWAIRYVFII